MRARIFSLAGAAARSAKGRMTLALAVQFNKRDLPDVRSDQVIDSRWSKAPCPVFFASALEGAGIVESFVAAAGERA